MMQLKNILLLMILTLVSAHSFAEDFIFTVNGKGVDRGIYDFIVKDAADHGKKVDDKIKEIILSKLVSSELVIQEAQKIGLDKSEDFISKKIQSLNEIRNKYPAGSRYREELVGREALVNIYIQDYMKNHPVSDSDIKAAYERFKIELGTKEYSARHILVASETEAKDIFAQLIKGGDFSKIAKEKSIDPGSKEKGGDLGWFALGGMVKPFGDAVAKLQKSEVSEPVQTQFGWHVIKLEDIREMKAPPYDKVKDNLQKQLAQRQLEKMLVDLRERATVLVYSRAGVGIKEGIEPNLNNNQRSTEVMTQAKAKEECIKLGFKPKTEKFGDCVLELTK